MMASQSTMIPEYPIYCPVCGDDGVDNSSTVSLDVSSRADIFQCFLKLFGVEWSGEAISFCKECRSQLILISELQRELQELKQRLAKREKEMENKLKSSEARFERRKLYSKDGRYFKLRKQILGDKISKPESTAADYLNGRKIADQLEQPLLLKDEDIKLEEGESPEDTELYHNPNLNYDDWDNHEQMEESDQSHLNEGENSPASQKQPQRRSLRVTKRKIVIDSPSEPEEEEAQDRETLHPSSSSRTPIKQKRKMQPVSDPDSESEIESSSSDEEFIPNEEKICEKRISPKNPNEKAEVGKGPKIITRYDIQLIRISEERDQYKCLKCEVFLPNKGNMLRRHVIKEHTTRFECSTCFKRFEQASSLTRHMEIYHSTTPSYSCPICARPFLRAYPIKSHLWSHYSEQDKADAVARGEKLPKKVSKKNFPCDQCFRSFATSLGLENHSKEQHGDEKTGEKELCGLCGAWVGNVKRHMQFKHVAEEDKRFECAICNKRFLLNCRLIKHRKLAHSNEKPFKCDVCKESFKFERYLKEHRLGHEDVKPFNCHLCGLGFTRGYVLKRHIGNVHEGKLRSDQKNSKRQVKDVNKMEDLSVLVN